MTANFQMTSLSPLVIGIAGGTGSGKSTVAQRIIEAIGPDHVALLDQDAYYCDTGHLPFAERRQINYDHPDSIEFDLLAAHVRTLIRGETVEKPVYSFTQSMRLPQRVCVPPAPIVIVEGILILTAEDLRNLLEIKLYVDTDDDIRLIRRIERDIEERGRTLSSVLEQYQRTVRPMHLTFVEPSKRYADIIIPRGGHNEVAINMVIATLRERRALMPGSPSSPASIVG